MTPLIKLVTVLLLLNACQSNVHSIPDELPERAGELPVIAFASLPRIQQAKLSPDGQFIAFLQNTGDKTALVTQDLHGKDQHSVLTNDDQEFSFSKYSWVNNNRLLVGVTYPVSNGGFKANRTRIIAVNRDGSEANADLINFEASLAELQNINKLRQHIPQYQDIFKLIPNDSSHVLISLDHQNPGTPDVYKLNVYNGELEMLVENPGVVNSWIFDREGKVRIGTVIVNATTQGVVYRKNPNDNWRVLKLFDGMKERAWRPLGFGDDPDWLYLLSDYQGKSAVFKINVNTPVSLPIIAEAVKGQDGGFELKANTPSAQPELVYADPKYDVAGELVYSTDGKHVIGVSYNAESSKIVYWDSEAQQVQKHIDKWLPKLNNLIVSRRNGKYLLSASSPEFAPVYYLYDADKDTLWEVMKTYPDLKPAVLAKTETVHFKARDGLELEGFLTRPIKSSNPGATIIFPHGGPWSRDVNNFNFWTQFLANRGWNVLQINFRGSMGYGKDLVEAGFQHWGMEMQDDITDGVHWLTAGKIADPTKICIVGASYGGYAVLMGLAKTPELYRCGVSFAPVTDLMELIEYLSDKHWRNSYLSEEFAEQRIGNWWTDQSRLKATSPYYLADQIHTPLLLVHGDEDRNVNVNQSRKMASALENAGFKDFQYIELENADHHLSRQQDRILFFRAMDAFLRKYQ